MADEAKAPISAGDHVRHEPTGETWYALGVSQARNELCAAGWPATTGKLTDCTLVKAGNGITPAEREHRERAFGSGWE
jgi:hypothetical protein